MTTEDPQKDQDSLQTNILIADTLLLSSSTKSKEDNDEFGICTKTEVGKT